MVETVKEKAERVKAERYARGVEIGRKLIEAHGKGASVIVTAKDYPFDVLRGVLDTVRSTLDAEVRG